MIEPFNDQSAADKFPLQINHNDDLFTRYLVTNEAVFFCNLMESDENASTLIFDHKMNLLSDNYFAYNELAEVIDDRQDSILWVSDDAKYNMQQEGVWPEQNGLKI